MNYSASFTNDFKQPLDLQGISALLALSAWQ